MSKVTVESVLGMVTDQILNRNIGDKDDQDRIDYTLIMDALADMKDVSTQVLRDVVDEIVGEIESRDNPDLITCDVCGGTRLELIQLNLTDYSRWWCNDCADWAEKGGSAGESLEQIASRENGVIDAQER